MKKKRKILKKETPQEKAVNAGIDRVYKKYGTDLQAFFRDVYRELAIKRQSEEREFLIR
jgi:hypothetical protein